MESVRQRIYDLCAIAENSDIPVLLMSNPGYAKTTCIKAYAKDMNYYLETLIGSRYEATDISGYQVNEPGEKNLKHKNPSWFERLWEAHRKGQKSLLFIDELSTCFSDVQGTLLSLIFDRTIGENKYLPEDTVIVSAANYAENLNDNFDLLAPTINRFCVFNLTDGIDDISLIHEFLTDDCKTATIRTFDDTGFDEATFRKEFDKRFEMLFKKYSRNSSLGKLDLHNSNIGDLYRKHKGIVLNNVSGRSLSFLQDILCSVVKLGIKDEKIINGISDGLAGEGTCSFKEDNQLEAYRREVHKICYELCVNAAPSKKVEVKLGDDIRSNITKFLSETENAENSGEYLLGYETELTKQIADKYLNSTNVFESFVNNTQEDKLDFINFMDLLTSLIKNVTNEENKKQLCGIHQSLLPIYNDLSGTEFKIKDFENIYGYNMPKFCDEVVYVYCDNKDALAKKIVKIAKYANVHIKMEDEDLPINAMLGNILAGRHEELHISK